MGVVYRAKDIRLGRPVALKFLLPSYSLDAAARARFLREAHSAATLDHPNLCSIHEVGTSENGRLFFAMPLYEGETLKARLATDAVISVGKILTIARQIASGLESAHAAGIVHRDLKPGNVMLLPDGTVKILDFGLAKARDQSLSATSSRFGTVSYMAPEQIRGQAVDGRADLWALGVMLFEMIARRKPFTGHEDIAVAHAILHDKPAFPSSTKARDDLSAELEDVVLKLLRKAPAKRYATASELLADLGRVETVATMGAHRRRWRRVKRTLRAQRQRVLAASAVLLVVAGGMSYAATTRRESNAVDFAPRTAIAVLPFQNLSAAGSWVYFASALQDEILAQLYTVPGLKVTGRSSLMRYGGPGRSDLRQIAGELGVRSLLTGSVGEGPLGLRVDVHLVDASTGAQQWAATYDRSVSDAYAIQSEIVQQIVKAVGVQLSDSQRQRLARRPIASGDVYREYLAGREYVTDGPLSWPKLDLAQLFLDKAIQFDSTFALARAARSSLYGWRHLLIAPPFPEHGALQRQDAEAAVRLKPDLPQAHFAMGVAHLVGDRRDAAKALAEFTIALKGLPGDADVWAEIAESHRILGNWNEAIVRFEKAVDLDPRNRGLRQSLGLTYLYSRRYAEAIQAFDTAAALSAAEPATLSTIALQKGWAYVLWRGQLDTLRAAAQRISRDADGQFIPALEYAQLLFWDRRTDSLLVVLKSARTPLLQSSTLLWPTSLLAGWAHQLRGDELAAGAAFDSARALTDRLIVIQREPDDAGRLHAARGLALAGLGRKEEAMRDASWLREAAPLRHDATIAPLLRESRARIYARLGDADRALDEVEPLLAEPSLMSVHTLRVDPLWDPIRNHPRFRALLARAGT